MIANMLAMTQDSQEPSLGRAVELMEFATEESRWRGAPVSGLIGEPKYITVRKLSKSAGPTFGMFIRNWIAAGTIGAMVGRSRRKTSMNAGGIEGRQDRQGRAVIERGDRKPNCPRDESSASTSA